MRMIFDHDDNDDTCANLRNIICILSACDFPRRHEYLVNLGREATKVGDDQLVPQCPEGNVQHHMYSSLEWIHEYSIFSCLDMMTKSFFCLDMMTIFSMIRFLNSTLSIFFWSSTSPFTS